MSYRKEVMSGSMSPIALIFRRKHFKYYHMYDTIDIIITKLACNLAPHQTETTLEGPPSFLPSFIPSSAPFKHHGIVWKSRARKGKLKWVFLTPWHCTLLYSTFAKNDRLEDYRAKTYYLY